MRICFASDLHVDHASQPHVKWPEAEVLLVAGDTANSLGPVTKTFAKLHKRGLYQRVMTVDGNHEHYSNAPQRRTIQHTLAALAGHLTPYATFLPTAGAVQHDGLWFVGVNGWYTCDASGEPAANRGFWFTDMNDDKWCGFTKHGEHMPWRLALFQADLLRTRMRAVLAQDPAARFVVVTHVSPTRATLSTLPGHLYTNYAYYSSALDSVLREFAPRIAAWHHGHTHFRSLATYEGVRVVCNPRGYPGENRRWQPVVLEVE